MKIKYLRLAKKEKKEIKKEYFNTKNGKYIKNKLKIALLCALGCLIFGIYNGIISIKEKDIINIIYSSIIFISGIIFLFFIRKVYLNKINEYVIKKK